MVIILHYLGMKKRSCSSHGSEKSNECVSSKKDKKFITFDYNNNLQCFMSSSSQARLRPSTARTDLNLKLKTNPNLLPSLSQEKQSPFSLLRVPRKNRGKMASNSKNAFNNSVLLLDHEGNEEDLRVEGKTDSSERPREAGSEEEDQVVTAIVNSCMRVITQDTEHSSNPVTARGMPQLDSTPTHMRPRSGEMGSAPTQMGIGQMAMGQMAMEQMGMSQMGMGQMGQMGMSQMGMGQMGMGQMGMGPEDYYYYMMKSPAARNRRAISNEESKAYVIELEKVVGDGRTTIMVRNIPNKYTQDMLLELFEKEHKKKFDFFYLPIDYNNNCNVGYAFLNFIHAKFIPEFYRDFHQRKWNKFNSVKVCQVCYARIQGTAQLEHHFEHSNVLQQRDRKFRPLIGLKNFHENITYLVQKQQDEHSGEQ